MKLNKLLAYCLAILVTFSAISVVFSIPFGVSAAQNGIFKDGGFEDGSSWDNSQGRCEVQDAFEGEFIVKSDSPDAKTSKRITVSANVSYTVNFWYRNSSADANDTFGIMAVSATDYIAKAELSRAEEWTNGSYTFNSGNAVEYLLTVEGSLELDCVSICENKPGNVLTNPSFEAGLSGWNDIEADATARIITSDVAHGFTAAKLQVGIGSGIYAEFPVKNNMYYSVSISYKGGGSEAGWGIARNRSSFGESNLLVGKVGFTSSTEWTVSSGSFYSGSNTKLRLVIWLGTTGELTVDNIEIRFDESKNLLANGDFEEGLTGWNAASTATFAITNTMVCNGEQSLKVGNTKYYHKISASFNVEKGKRYVACFNIKGATNWSQWGIAILEHGLGANDLIKSENGNNVFGYLSETYNEWTTIQSEVFTFSEDTTLYFTLQSSQWVDAWYADDIYITEVISSDNEPILSNGSFEDGLTGWNAASTATYQVTDAEVSDGKNSLKIGHTKYYHKISTPFKVEKGKKYMVSFDYKGDPQYTAWCVAKAEHSLGADDMIKTVDGELLRIYFGSEIYNDWTNIRSKVFTAEDDMTLYLTFQDSYWEGISYVDNIYIFEVSDDSLIINGDCKRHLAPFAGNEDYFWLDDSTGYNDNTSIAIDGGHYQKLSQKVSVAANTNYEFSFWYKGKVPDIAAWAVSSEISFASDKALVKGTLEDSNTWKQVSGVFNSGNQTEVYAVFQTSIDSSYRIDGIRLAATEKQPAETITLKPAYIIEQVIGDPFNDYPYITSDEYNLISNNGFENLTVASESDAVNLANGNAAIISDSQLAYSGSNVLKFSAGSETGYATKLLKLKKNTKYWVTLFVKSPTLSNTQTINLTFGIADPDTGNFLVMENQSTEESRNWTEDKQIMPTPDNEWHLLSYSFNTYDTDTLAFLIKGTNSTAYFDDIYIFEDGYGEKYIAPIQNLTDVVLTDREAELLGTENDSTDNLIQNFDLSETDIYWQDTNGTLFGESLNIVDSGHNIQEKSLYYENTKYDYPNRIYYIKWVDVEPHTDYTFSARYAQTSVGEGFFGIISGYRSDTDLCSVSENVVYPTLIKSYTFEQRNYDANQNWRDVGFSFNTQERNRVGFVVFDGGGSAYIDDIRIFKTENGAAITQVSDNFPTTLISKDSSITVSGGRLIQESVPKTIADVIKRLENNKYLRVFDADGAEITDYSGYMQTGMEVRLMNGPVIKDRATVIIPGDVNGDGLINANDSALVADHLTTAVLLEGVAIEAADYDRDGTLTVYDVMHNSSEAKKSNVRFVLDGPKSFNPGDEIEISLITDTSGILGVNGLINFEKDYLEFVSASLDVSGDWKLSVANYGDDLFFAAVDLSGDSSLKKSASVITFTFKVGNIRKYADAAITLSQLEATTGNNLLISDSYTYDNTLKNTDGGNNTSEIIRTQETVAAANRLAVLKLDEAELYPEFDPEIKEYTATVPFEIEKVTVTAIAADENATVTIGDTKLEYVGKNIVAVQVVSADGLQRTYKIAVTRESPTSVPDTNNGLSLWIIIAICCAVVLLISAIILLIIIIIKKRKKDKKN